MVSIPKSIGQARTAGTPLDSAFGSLTAGELAASELTGRRKPSSVSASPASALNQFREGALLGLKGRSAPISAPPPIHGQAEVLDRLAEKMSALHGHRMSENLLELVFLLTNETDLGLVVARVREPEVNP